MNNSQVAHHFIYESSEAQGSNFSCNGSKLYSYSSLMATIVREKKIILIDERISHYSPSSQKHRGHLLRAIPSDYSVFEWYWKDGSFIEAQHDAILNLIGKQSRARKADYSNQIKRLIDLCDKYSNIFMIEEKDKVLLDDINTIDINELLSSSKHLIEENKARLLALRAKEDARRKESRQKVLNKFLGHNNVVFDPNYNSVYLKVIEDKLYTSNFITVNIMEAITLYKAYLAGKNILNARLGHYVVVKASKTSVTIGCTTISAVELNRVLGEYLNCKTFDELEELKTESNSDEPIYSEPEGESFDDLLNQLDTIINDLGIFKY